LEKAIEAGKELKEFTLKCKGCSREILKEDFTKRKKALEEFSYIMKEIKESEKSTLTVFEE